MEILAAETLPQTQDPQWSDLRQQTPGWWFLHTPYRCLFPCQFSSQDPWRRISSSPVKQEILKKKKHRFCFRWHMSESLRVQYGAVTAVGRAAERKMKICGREPRGCKSVKRWNSGIELENSNMSPRFIFLSPRFIFFMTNRDRQGQF